MEWHVYPRRQMEDVLSVDALLPEDSDEEADYIIGSIRAHQVGEERLSRDFYLHPERGVDRQLK